MRRNGLRPAVPRLRALNKPRAGGGLTKRERRQRTS
jgi:hypothetical protein